MNEFTIVSGADAAVRPWQLIVALAGPTGSGKTVSSLRLANGIREVVGGAVGAIDTESGRMTRHLKDYGVNWYLELRSPYSSTRYLEAVQALVAKGCKTIIIDGLSAEHDGEGGHLEQHEKNVTRMAGEGADFKRRDAVKFAAWIAPKSERNKMIQGLLKLPCHYIFNFRAKEKLALIKVMRDGKEKIEPQNMGWQPVAGEELAFEATVLCVLPPRSEGVPDWTAQAAKIEGHHRSAFPAGQPITEETGRAMARFASEGVVKLQPEYPHVEVRGTFDGRGIVTETKNPAFDEAVPYALGGRAVLTGYWKSLPKAAKAAFKPHGDALGKLADQADREKAAKESLASADAPV
jgi:hypothetical protein